MSENGEAANPMRAAQRLARQELPRRFYTTAGFEPAEGGFGVVVDGKPVRTPARRRLTVPSREVAEGLAAEWNAQAEHIEPGTMPLTRIANSAIDRVAEEMAAVRADIVRFAGSDLLCYRADGPQSLVAAQDAAWTPLATWARDALGARFILSEGVVHVHQTPEALAAIDAALAAYDAFALAAIHTITTLSGSAIISLAVARKHIGLAEAWTAAHVDEDWQMSQWGRDEAALDRRTARWREMEAAGLILGALR